MTIRPITLLGPLLLAVAVASGCSGPAFGTAHGSGGTAAMAGGTGGTPNNNNPLAGRGGALSATGGTSAAGAVGNVECRNAADCDDVNACTLDVCNSDNACLHVPVDGLCESDNSDCTNDMCSAGVCVHPANGTCDCGTDPDCDDSNPCTDDQCGNGTCLYQNNTDPCPDEGNACTDDVCGAGACLHPSNNQSCVDDNDNCTDDVCGGGLCTHPSNGQCGCVINPDCDDSNPCTDDSCDLVSGDCLYANNSAPCVDDGSACTEDMCHQGTCIHANPQPIPERLSWTASASDVLAVAIAGCPGDASEPPAQAIDQMPATRWTSGKSQAGDEWFQIGFGSPVTLNHITLNGMGAGPDNCMGSGGDFPRHYQVRVTDTPNDDQALIVAEGNGTVGNTVIQFEQPHSGRYVLISQTAVPADGKWWSIHEIDVACQ